MNSTDTPEQREYTRAESAAYKKGYDCGVRARKAIDASQPASAVPDKQVDWEKKYQEVSTVHAVFATAMRKAVGIEGITPLSDILDTVIALKAEHDRNYALAASATAKAERAQSLAADVGEPLLLRQARFVVEELQHAAKSHRSQGRHASADTCESQAIGAAKVVQIIEATAAKPSTTDTTGEKMREALLEVRQILNNDQIEGMAEKGRAVFDWAKKYAALFVKLRAEKSNLSGVSGAVMETEGYGATELTPLPALSPDGTSGTSALSEAPQRDEQTDSGREVGPPDGVNNSQWI